MTIQRSLFGAGLGAGSWAAGMFAFLWQSGDTLSLVPLTLVLGSSLVIFCAAYFLGRKLSPAVSGELPQHERRKLVVFWTGLWIAYMAKDSMPPWVCLLLMLFIGALGVQILVQHRRESRRNPRGVPENFALLAPMAGLAWLSALASVVIRIVRP